MYVNTIRMPKDSVNEMIMIPTITKCQYRAIRIGRTKNTIKHNKTINIAL